MPDINNHARLSLALYQGISAMKIDYSCLATICLAIFTGAPAHAQESADNSLATALTSGDAHVNLRYRYQFVDQDGFSENANASTI